MFAGAHIKRSRRSWRVSVTADPDEGTFVAQPLLTQIVRHKSRPRVRPIRGKSMKPIPYERVMLADAKRVHDGKPSAAKPDGAIRRGAVKSHEILSAQTVEWLSALPANVRPDHLAGRYARIANAICSLWQQPSACTSYMADLMIIRRASREGFPLPIAKEIARLAAHHAMLHPLERRWTQAR